MFIKLKFRTSYLYISQDIYYIVCSIFMPGVKQVLHMKTAKLNIEDIFPIE